MDEIIKQESITQFNYIRGQETLHPLVSVLDQSKSKPVAAARFYSGIYIIFLKDIKCGEMSYGRKMNKIKLNLIIYFLYLCNPYIMRIYNSNSNDALIKDLGPFKTNSANHSFQGKKIWEYKAVSQPKNVGTNFTYGKGQTLGTAINTTIQDS